MRIKRGVNAVKNVEKYRDLPKVTLARRANFTESQDKPL